MLDVVVVCCIALVVTALRITEHIPPGVSRHDFYVWLSGHLQIVDLYLELSAFQGTCVVETHTFL